MQGRVALLPIVLMLVASLVGCSANRERPPGGFLPDKTYVLSETEARLDCRQLGFLIEERIAVLKGLPAAAKRERAAAAPTLLLSLGRFFGSKPAGFASYDAFEREKSRLIALDAAAKTAGCPPIDIVAPIAETETALAAAIRG